MNLLSSFNLGLYLKSKRNGKGENLKAVVETEIANHHENAGATLDTGIDLNSLYLRSSSNKSLDTTCGFSSQIGNVERKNDVVTGTKPLVSCENTKEAPPLDNRMQRRVRFKEQRSEQLEKWFGIPRQRMSPEVENELAILELRNFTNTKNPHQAGSTAKIQRPTHFHFARVVDGGIYDRKIGENTRIITKSRRNKTGKSLLRDLLNKQSKDS